MLPDYLRSVPVIASVSGGKDSAALCLWLREQGIEYRAVHMDTKWEHPLTDEYIRTDLERAIGPIEWIYPPMGFADLCRRKGIFPGRITRFCTSELKLFPFFRWLEAQYGTAPVVNAVGIRAAESTARAGLDELENVSYGTIWRPLLAWTEEQVIEIHRRHDLRPNPLYLRGASRVGCWPCIFARKSEVKLVADVDAQRIDEIRALEAELQTMRTRAPGLVTFFNRDLGQGPEYIPIDEVVRWSRTSRGGRQFELFTEEDRSGCLRWGMCDA